MQSIAQGWSGRWRQGVQSLRRGLSRSQRAGENFYYETFWPKSPAARNREYCVRAPTELSVPADAHDFPSRPDSHVVAHPAAVVELKTPQVLGIAAADLRFCGPFPDDIHPTAFPELTTSPPLTLARLSDVIVMPRQIVLAQDPTAGPSDTEWFVLDSSFNSMWERSFHPEIQQISDQRFRLRRAGANFELLPGCSLHLECWHGDHYGHVLADVMTMAWAYRYALDLGLEIQRVLVSRRSGSFMFPLLEAMGIPRGVIAPVRRPSRCEEALFATKCYLTQSYTSPVAMRTWRQVRDALDRGTGPERIYVSRASTPNRPMTNEAAVEAIFASRGFVIVHPEKVAIEEQIALWANAKLAAGSAGSNMYGLAFQRRLERSFLINSPNMIQFAEHLLQAGHSSETTLYVGRSQINAVHAPWFVDLADLERQVDRWIR